MTALRPGGGRRVAGERPSVFDALARLTVALGHTTTELHKAVQAVDALAFTLRQPAFRRALMEYELGYRIPDWIWRVREQQREQFGSGNGKTERE